MPNAEEFYNDPLQYFVGLVGEPGSGKSRQSITFPKSYFVSLGDSYGLKTILEDPNNAALRTNLVWHEAMDLEDKKDAVEIFKPTASPGDKGSIYGILAHAKKLAAEKAIETFVLDGGSFLSDYKGAAIAKGTGTTDADRWSYYRQMKNDLTWFVNANIMPLITRHKLNVILTFHVQRASDEEKEKLTTKVSDWAPRIEGSFRHAIAALPRAMIYLHQRIEIQGTEQKVEYKAYCQPVRVKNVGIVPAKNSYNLPPVIDMYGKNLYDILQESMKRAKSSKTPTAATGK